MGARREIIFSFKTSKVLKVSPDMFVVVGGCCAQLRAAGGQVAHRCARFGLQVRRALLGSS